jgi:Domain of unknown function (DUF1929)/Ricin-type beta-trefoil lectin domain-like/Clostridial hydrophobic W
MCMALTACGGGSGSDGEVAAAASGKNQVARQGKLAVYATGNWTKCADEGGVCQFSGTMAVRYGKGTQWSETLVFQSGPMGGAPCKADSSFYGDPAPGVLKECQISPVSGDNGSSRLTQGEWGPLQAWPIVPVHISLLPSGRLVGHNATNDDLWPQLDVMSRLWDPEVNALTAIDSRDVTLKSELFCVGFTHLPDGSLLTAGNQPNDKTDYDRNVNRFNFFTQTWSREADTAYFRYYPSMATLGNGDMITFGGTKTASPFELMRFDGSWKSLSGMSFFQDINYYPWGQTAPNGKLFYVGPDPAMRYIDPSGAGAMSELGERDSFARNYGSYAMYDIGKLLVAGGAQPATNTAVVVDVNSSTPKIVPTASMSNARRHGNLTILADGSVLATGGYAGSVFTDVSNTEAVMQAERWDPATGKWSSLASAQRHRGYHSVAILLPDGRVAVGGGGMPYKTGFNQENIEIYSPPYLFETGGGSYALKSGVTQSVHCSNFEFGDPAPGISKSCSYVAAPAGTPGLPAGLPTGAITCASEGGTCTLPSGLIGAVYYGANQVYTHKIASGAVPCSNSHFGDPIFGAAKTCSYVPSPLPTDSAFSCSAEYGTCSIPGGIVATVYYGASGKFTSKEAQSGTVACNNATFGDPVAGTAKACSYVPKSTSGSIAVSSLPSNAQTCASEYGSCKLPDGLTATVYYGAATGGGSQLAVRPTISYAPDSVGYGRTFLATSAQAATISKAHLIKLGSVTHANNQGQRLVPLKYTVNGNNLQIIAPVNPNVAPPGYYMLILVNDKGVPSVARMVQLQQHAVVALISRQTGKALEVSPEVNGDGSSIRMVGNAAEPGVNMAWDFVPTDGGHFKLVSRANGLALSVPGSSLQSGEVVKVQADVSGANQQWLPARSTLGYMTLKARHSGFALEVVGASTADGAGLVQQALSTAPAAHDEWIIVPVGYQRIVGVQSGKVAGIVGRSSNNGAGVEISPNGGDTSQAFKFVPRSDGYLSIEAASTGSVLGVAGGSTQATAVLDQESWTGASSQQWALVPMQDGSFMLQVRHTGQYMNVLNDKVDTGTPVGQYPDNGGLPNQFWRLIPAVSLDPHQRNASGRAIASAHVSNVGWMPYVAASNTIGQPDTSNGLEAVKISVKGLRGGLQVSYRTQSPDGTWAGWVNDNQQAGTVGQSTPIQAFQATLSGMRDSCSIRYRGYVKGSGWQSWMSEGQTAGVAMVTTPITGLQVNVECTMAALAYKP